MDEQKDLQTPGEAEEKTEKSGGLASTLFDVLEMFAWSFFAVFIIFTFAVRLCSVDGSSMANTLQNGEKLLLSEIGYTPKQGDIIVFHLTNEEADLQNRLVKRVIATGGQHIDIHFHTAEIYINGERYDDEHAQFFKNYKTDENNRIDTYLQPYTYGVEYDRTTGILSLDVPEGHLFVMGDNRNNSKDSRDADILFVDERCVLGKVVLRLYPFTFFS